MAAARIAWTVIVNVVTLAIILLVLNAGANQGQALVVACLVLIYVFVSGALAVVIRTIVDSELRSAGRFARLAKLLNDPDCVIYDETVADEMAKLRGLSVRLWISSVFGVLAWFVALFYLISAF